ncbi:MAG: hypothetical protein HFH68_00190 [Lachnospiraceae bacterium]|nr:hypothetical protein [Lachnospiraceae bacterium]
MLGIEDGKIQKEFAISPSFNLEGYQTSENVLKAKLGDEMVSNEVKSKVIKALSASEIYDAVNSDMVNWSGIVHMIL